VGTKTSKQQTQQTSPWGPFNNQQGRREAMECRGMTFCNGGCETLYEKRKMQKESKKETEGILKC
jgi:hypothetical protein